MPSNNRFIAPFLIIGFVMALLLGGCGKKVPEFKEIPSAVPPLEEWAPTTNPNDAFK